MQVMFYDVQLAVPPGTYFTWTCAGKHRCALHVFIVSAWRRPSIRQQGGIVNDVRSGTLTELGHGSRKRPSAGPEEHTLHTATWTQAVRQADLKHMPYQWRVHLRPSSPELRG